ncbi:hypothetical protein [Chelativorans sp. M5D2P16]|uniref:hypothetical protein n=1 Tax=Chelativorans sp. M5D2P16 TaxID=3095678 RepID=UPI002ACA8BAE|nr:hypothetical protein [Chelativorans sp. M5D2P16]MDZ5697789.1 hypothetical protein [Chelativorans sp. M5D2P16]
MPVFWIAMAILGVGLALLIANHENGRVFGLENSAFAATLYLGLWGAVLILGIAGRYHRRGTMLRDLAFWALLILVLSVAYAYRLDLAAFFGL